MSSLRKYNTFKDIAQVGLINVIKKEYEESDRFKYDNPDNIDELLRWAVVTKNYNYIKYLVNKGGNINQIFKIGQYHTYLEYAIYKKDQKLIDFLISIGAKITNNIKN